MCCNFGIETAGCRSEGSPINGHPSFRPLLFQEASFVTLEIWGQALAVVERDFGPVEMMVSKLAEET